MTEVVFEPPVGALPSIFRLAEARNLSQLTFQTSPYAFIAVREAFQRAGLHEQAQAFTFALNRGLRRQAPPIERALGLIFFELTYQYGMAPLRPLRILAMLIPVFAGSHIIMLWRYRRRAVSATRSWRVGFWQGCRVSRIGLTLSVMALLPRPWRHDRMSSRLLRETAPRYRVRMRRWASVTTRSQSVISVYLLVLWIMTAFRMPGRMAWLLSS